MNLKKTLKSISFLWLGSLLGSGSTFAINMILARQLGKENFGVFSSVMSSIVIFSILASFGINQVLLKLFGKEGYEGTRWIKPSIKFSFISLIFTSALVIIWSIYGPHEEPIKWMLLIMIGHVFGYVSILLVVSRFQLEERYRALSFWQLSPNLLKLIIIVVCYYLINWTLSLNDIFIIYSAIGLIFFVTGLYFIWGMQTKKFKPAGHQNKLALKEFKIPKIKELFFETLPFGLGSIFAFIYVQSDIVMLKYFAGDIPAGLYAASFVILTALYMFPNILYNKFLMPKFHRWANFDRKKFYLVYKRGNLFMFFSGVILMILIILLSSVFIPLVFGIEFKDSIPLMKVLSLNLPFIFVAYSVSATLVTKKHMQRKVIYMGVVAILNISLNMILIPKFEAMGAAIATLISNVILVVIYFIANNKYVFNNDNFSINGK